MYDTGSAFVLEVLRMSSPEAQSNKKHGLGPVGSSHLYRRIADLYGAARKRNNIAFSFTPKAE